MKVKLKDKLSRVLSLLLVVNMVLALVIATDTYYFDSGNTAYAAGTSSTMGSDNYTAKANITIGSRYSFGGYTWIAAQDLGNNTIALQSTGVTHGYWPGYAMAKFGGNANSYYNQDITGQDISGFDAKTQALYNTISYAQSGNSGLYLVSNAQAGSTSNGSSGSGYYWTALKEAATNYSSFGSPSGYAWLGTVYGGGGAWCVNSSGDVCYGGDQYGGCVVAPAFNLNTSKVTVSGSNIVAFSESTGISATKSSIQSIKEGQSVNLSSVISNVTYAGGTANGHTASYTVTCDKGTISGTTYTAPTNVTSSNDKVTFTVISTRNAGWKSTVQVNLAPNAAGKIEVVKGGNYPSEITSGDQIDFSNYLTVKAKDAAGNDDGTITDYDVTGDGFSGTGHVLTAGTVTDAKTITLTVTARQTIGTTSYDGKTYGSEDDEYAGKLTIKVKPGTNGYTDRDGYEDGKGFHKYEDKSTGITWNYKYDDSGNIRFLYTEDNVEKIISKGKVLLVPSSIGGVPVVGIGGGRKNEDTIPFIPTSGSKSNNTWTSIYIPASVQFVNDEAFAGNQASADIVIPSTVKQIGVGAFKGSKITSLAINTDSETMELFESAFEGIPTLKDVAIRGSHAIIGHYAFKDDTGITSIDIPHGTSFGKSSQNDSYAFAGTTGLELIKINTDTVYSNIFSGNKALKRVIFGDDVDYVNYDWSGTAATEGNQATLSSTVDRSTYVLNAETIFKMSKVTGGSPFGYKGKLTVVGKDHDLNKWENKYDNTNDPVIAKVAYLADNYKTNSDINKYAKGTADSITISVETDPSENEGVTSSVSKTQTGIEAYSTNIVLTGKNVEKDKVSVYKMFGTTQKDKYATEDFYVLRTTDAQTLLNKSVTDQKNISGTSDWYAVNSEEVMKWFSDKDSVTAGEDDLKAGTIDLTVIVLHKDSNGNVLVHHEQGSNMDKVRAYTYALAVPVKAYSAEDDFLENYGSYDTVISKIDDLNKDVSKLTSDLDAKTKEYDALKEKADQLQKDKDKANADNADLIQQVNDLNAQIKAKDAEIASLKKDLTATEKKLTDTINSYAKLLDATKLNKSDYTYTVTKDGVTKYYVFVNGEEAEYDINSATEVTLPNGEKVTVYTGTFASGDTFKFYIADDGVHVVTLDEAGKNVESDNVSTDTVAAMQRKIAAQLQAMKDQLTKLESALDEIAGSLDIGDLDSKTDDEKVEAIKAAIAALNKKVSDLEQTVASKDKLIESLKEQNGQQAATIEQANATIKKLNEQITAVNGKLQETQKALDTANKNLDTATGNLSDAQQQITTISGNLQKTENDLATAQEALAEKQTDLDAANALIESTNAALAKAQGDLTSARSDLANVQKTLSDTQAELEATKTALNTANTSLAGAQQEITSLNAEVENLRNTIAGYQSVLNSIKKALGLTDAADNAEILASISDLDTRLGALDEKIASLAAMLGIDTAGKSDSDLMDEIISKVTDLTKDYDTVTKNYNKIVKKIYGADDTVDVSNKSVDEVLAAIDSLSGDTSAIAKQLQEAITGEKVSDSDVKQLTELLDQVKTMKSDLDEKSDLLNQIMQALGITDSAQIIQTIVNLKTQVASLEKENAELKAGGVTTGNTGKGYTKDTEVNRSSASYTSGYNAGYAKAAQDNAAGSLATQITSLTNSNSALTKENASLKAENETLSNGIDNLYDQVTNADVSMLSSTGSNTGSGKIQRIGNAISNLISDNQKASSKYKNLQSENKKLKNSNESLSAKIKTLTETNSKLSVSEKTLKSQVSSLKNRVNNVKEASSTAPSNVNRYNSVSNNNAGSTSNTASVKPSNRTSEGNIGTVSNQSNGTEEKSSDTGNTAKKKNKKSNANDTIESENITRNATLDASVGTERQLGEVLETMLPTTTTQAENQQATVSLNEIDDSKVVDITTNAKDTNNVTDEQKNNALKIVNWYMNNLEELGNLGSPEVKEAATDSTKSVTFDMLASFDVTPSDEQQNAIDNQQNVNLTVSSPDIEDGALYLVIHESDLRPNTFDVLLTQAFGNEIDINVPDLSPVTLTKITVGDSDVISSSSTQLSTEETPQEVTNNGKNNSGFKIVMYILIVVALGGAAALIIIPKRRKDGVSRK